MELHLALVRRSLDRSRTRVRVLVMLSSLSEAFPRQLARGARVSPERLRAVMEGSPPRFATELSLLALGLAERRVTTLGRMYVITPRGRRHARRLTARWRGQSKKKNVVDG